MDFEIYNLPLKVAAIMRDFNQIWFIAGGWAIDLYLGKVTRPHSDIEIAIFRRDQTALQDYLAGWLLQKVINGERSVWQRGERLQSPIHELHCFNEVAEPRQFEILLNESNENEWMYRRNEKVKRSLAKCQMVSSAGIKFLCPEIALLYKSKNPRASDEQDFETVAQQLDTERKKWLSNAIAACDTGHRWLQVL